MILKNNKGVLSSRISVENAPIQQIKAAGLTARAANTQGVPQVVSNVSISISKSGANRSMRVSFIQNPNDPYFDKAHLYIQQGNNNPTLVASGTSPIVATLPKSNAPVTVHVVSSGNWGTTPLSTSPSKAVSLA